MQPERQKTQEETVFETFVDSIVDQVRDINAARRAFEATIIDHADAGGATFRITSDIAEQQKVAQAKQDLSAWITTQARGVPIPNQAHPMKMHSVEVEFVRHQNFQRDQDIEAVIVRGFITAEPQAPANYSSISSSSSVAP